MSTSAVVNKVDNDTTRNPSNQKDSDFSGHGMGSRSSSEAEATVEKLAIENNYSSEGSELLVVRLTKKEALAIREYASQCGETIPDLFRKAIIREATLADGYGADDEAYRYSMKLPSGQSHSIRKDQDIVQENCNKIRSILGWTSIKL